MKPLQIKPGDKVRLRDFDPEDTSAAPGDKAKTNNANDRLTERLCELQELLYANSDRAVLLLFQGLDASGKDGAIRKVLHYVNPAGVETAYFKQPSVEEQAHEPDVAVFRGRGEQPSTAGTGVGAAVEQQCRSGN